MFRKVSTLVGGFVIGVAIASVAMLKEVHVDIHTRDWVKNLPVNKDETD